MIHVGVKFKEKTKKKKPEYQHWKQHRAKLLTNWLNLKNTLRIIT